MSNFELEISYRPGKSNSDADGLSRLSDAETNSSGTSIIIPDSVKAICQTLQKQPYIESLALGENIENLDEEESSGPSDSLKLHINWAKLQDKDEILQFWKKKVKSGRKPRPDEIYPKFLPHILTRNFDQLSIDKDVLWKETKIDDETRRLLVVPSSQIKFILTEIHNKFGQRQDFVIT